MPGDIGGKGCASIRTTLVRDPKGEGVKAWNRWRGEAVGVTAISAECEGSLPCLL